MSEKDERIRELEQMNREAVAMPDAPSEHHGIHGRAEARLHLLSKVGLLAGANDLEDVLSRTAGLAVPELADWSVFALVEDGLIQRPRIVHPDPQCAVLASDLLGTGTRPFEDIQLEIVDVDTLHGDTSTNEFFTLLKRLEATTAIVVPFVVMGATVALAAFVYGTESGRRHHADDLPIAEELGRRAGQIVENARLHAELARALEYRERVMGVLGHDLRNPLTRASAGATARAANRCSRAHEGRATPHPKRSRADGPDDLDDSRLHTVALSRHSRAHASGV